MDRSSRVSTRVGSTTDLLASIEQLNEAAEAIIAHGPDTWERLERADRESAIARMEKARKKLSAADAAFITSYEPHFPAGPQLRARALSRLCNTTLREARTRLAAAQRISERPDQWSADPTAPHPDFMPHLTDAVAQGLVDSATVEQVDKQIRVLPGEVQNDITAVADEPIARLVSQHGPDIVRSLQQFLLDLVGAEEPYTDKDHQRMRSLTIGKQGTDGMTPIRGLLTPALSAKLHRLMADHAGTGGTRGTESTESTGRAGRTTDTEEDTRSPEQRRHDVLDALLDSGYGPGKALATGRGTTTIVAVMSIDQIASRSGTVLTDAGVHIPASSLLTHPENLDTYLQVLDFEGRTLYLGRSRRLGSLDQYLALCGEEGMSSAPGSDSPPAYCHIHHIDDWSSGGKTDLDNLTLTSPAMHAQVDDSRSNDNRWWTTVAPSGSGRRVNWIPPADISPDREPVHNDHPTTWRHPGCAIRRTLRERNDEEPPHS